MAKCKENFTRICADVPTEWIEAIRNYNKTHIDEIVVSKHIRATIEKLYKELH